ncbi:aminoglycoside phosphotransferase [Paenibacillus vortex V453]|uniref:Aminoglycoside phosphotransferase n=1 Tax=Paenibacillus vortex V453 TaxID=715225 RepID=A0A2R9SSK4_9BACL|nr:MULTISPECIES: aminoglycoside phosphotransferase family protein [Paenibacillus]AWP26752.1 aminoglycoside phosphotransferase [Paenibacillus sp. Cedars]EFU40291.1 aminoglycoside phosphotransferase [Paenibacillus vortex V453]
MKTFKPEMTLDLAIEHLNHIEGETVRKVTPIEMGELSKVFSYRKGDADYVIHFKSNRESLDKQLYIYNKYGAPSLPIPRIHKIGEFGDIHYSISDKVSGTPISALEPEQIRNLIPSLVHHFILINQVSVGDSGEGFGWITPEGKASHRSWLDCLESFFDQEQEGFHHGWKSLYESSFLEQDFFEEVYDTMLGLAQYSPQERYLVHGDFHLGNMLGEDPFVTGIVDWEMAMYGDFMLDVAVLHIWHPMLEFPQRLLQAMTERGVEIPYFEERLLCHQLFKTLDALRFYAKKDDANSYQFIKNRIMSLIDS